MARAPRADADMRETAEQVQDTQGEVMPPRERTGVVAVRQAPQFTFGQSGDDRFEVVKYAAVPMLEIPAGMSFVAEFIDKARILLPIEGYKSKYKGDHWASTIRSTQGEARLFTWNTVFRTEMMKSYPDDDYVGKWFRVTRLPIKAGKDYATFSIIELALRDAA